MEGKVDKGFRCQVSGAGFSGFELDSEIRNPPMIADDCFKLVALGFPSPTNVGKGRMRVPIDYRATRLEGQNIAIEHNIPGKAVYPFQADLDLVHL